MGKGGKSPKMRVTEYFCSVHYGICQGTVDTINHIRINDKIAWKGPIGQSAIFEINKQKLYGGIKKEGGVQGYAIFQKGDFDQFCSHTVAAKLGRTPANAPAYRGLTNIMLTGGPSLVNEEAPVSDVQDGGGGLFSSIASLFNAGNSKENGSRSQVGNRRGFYWSANQPYIWPCAFHITRVPSAWYPETAYIYTGTSTPRAIFFAIDNSGSMDAVRRNTVKEAFGELVVQLKENIRVSGMTLHMGITVWGDSRNSRTYFNMSENDLTAAQNFVNIYLNGNGGGTDFDQAAQGALEFFDQTLPDSIANPPTVTTTTLTGVSGGGGGNRGEKSSVFIPSQGLFGGVPAVSPGDSIKLILEDESTRTFTINYVSFSNEDGQTWWHLNEVIPYFEAQTVDMQNLGDASASPVEVEDELDRRVMFFITDGLATGTTHETAKTTMIDLLDRNSGKYSLATETAVDTYSVNIVESDTSQSALLDNTTGLDKSVVSGGTVPVIGAEEAGQLTALIRSALGSGEPPTANAAHIIYEALTDRAWGMGAHVSALDENSFRDAADIFFIEGFGLSMIWTQQQTIQAFVQEVLDHVEANLYVDPATGKFVLKPIRDDYDIETLEVFNETNCTVRSFQRRSPAEITNEINLTWTNPETEEEEVITQQDLGGVVINNGEIISDNRNYYGIRDRFLASKVLARDLSAVTAPLATAEIAVNRSAWKYAPGGVLKLSSQEHDAEELVMRVAKINYGKPGDSEIIAFLAQDIFSFTRPQAVTPPGTELETGGKEPTHVEFVEFMTLGYFLTVNLVPPAAQVGVSYPEVFVGILASSINTDVTGIDIIGETTDAAGNTYTEATGTIMPVSRGYLSETFEMEAETLTPGFSSLTVGAGPQPGGFALIGLEDGSEQGREIVMFVSNDGANWTIKRGVLDTIPRKWNLGTPIRFFGPASSITDAELETAFASRDYRLAMKTTLGAFPESLAQTESFTPGERPHLPLRPANVRVEGSSWDPVDAEGLNEVNVTWSNRNRLTEDSQVLGWEDPGVSPETGQFTKITIMESDTRQVVNEIIDLPGEAYAIPVGSFGTATRAIIRVTSTRDGLESLQGHEIEVTIAAGYGYGYGLSYGG